MKRGWLAAGVSLLTFCAFLPALRNGFVWDDAPNFLANPHWRGLGWAQVRWAFTTAWLGPYQPLSWLSSGLDYAVWGLRPVGYHLGNLLLHSANAALVFFLSLRLLEPAARDEEEAVLSAAAAALLFSVHPLRVEAVAWATERRTVLAGLFYFSSLLCWLEGGRARKASLPLFACSLLSKGIGIGLPFTLLALDVWPLRRRPDWKEKAPFFALAAAFAAAELAGYSGRLSVDPLAGAAKALFALVFYAAKTVVPSGLSPSYDFVWPLLFCAPAVAGAAWWLWSERTRKPWAWASAIHYAACLAPVLGLVKFGEHAVADRYSYLACAFLPVLAAGGLASLGREESRKALLGAAAAAAFLGWMSWGQAGYWRDDIALWTRARAVDPGSAFARKRLSQAYYNVGNGLLETSRPHEAGRFYLAAANTDPENALAHNNLGTVLLKYGRPDMAAVSFCRALRIDPALQGPAANLRSAMKRYPNLSKALTPECLAAVTRPE